MKLIDRHIIRQLLVPFCLGALLFAALLILQTAFSSGDLMAGKAHFGLFCKYILYQIPEMASYILPVAIAFGVALATTKLAGDLEYFTLCAARVSPARIFLPVLFFALVVGLAALANEQWLAPASATLSRATLNKMLASSGRIWPSEHLFFKGPTGRLFYVRRVNQSEHKLFDVTVVDRKTSGTTLLVAPQAVFAGSHWSLKHGAEYQLDASGHLRTAHIFTSYPLQLKEAVQEYWADTREVSELSLVEIAQTVKVMQQAGIISRRAKELTLEANFKLVLPVTCVVLAVLVFPLALQFARGGYAAGLLVAVLVVFFANGALNWSRALANLGVIGPTIAAWWSPVVLLALGLVLFARGKVGR